MRARASVLAFLISCGLHAQGVDPYVDAQQSYAGGQYEQAAEKLRALVAASKPARLPPTLYTLAMVQLALGHNTEADVTLQRLTTDFGNDVWALPAYALLAQRAAARSEWERAGALTAQFLDRYMATPYATVDDATSGQMTARLLEYARRRAPGDSVEVVRKRLATQYPPSSGAGRALAWSIEPDPADADANLVHNPAFDLDGRQTGLPVGWSYHGTEPDLWDDCDGVLGDSGVVRSRSGGFCAGKFTSWGRHRGWLYQRVRVLPGQRYDVSAFGLTPTTGGQPGQLRLGVDVTGAIDPEADGVRWTPSVSPEKEYERMALEGPEAVRVEGDALTVFLEIRQDNPVAPNAMLFDDVSVRRAR